MSKKIFVHKYVKRFVYVCVTVLGCFMGCNVVQETKDLCMNMSKGLYMCISQG